MPMHYRSTAPYYAIAAPMSDAALIRNIIREELAGRRRKRGKPDTRPVLNVRLEHVEMRAIDAAAEQIGLTRSEFVRRQLAQVMGIVIQPKIALPHLQAHNRRKPASLIATENSRMDKAEAGKRVVSARLAAQKAMADYGAAVPNAPVMREMIGQTAPVPIVPKLPKAGG